MDIFPLPAANGAVRATGAKPPQGGSATESATLFAGGIVGGKPVDADLSTATERAAPSEIANGNGAANSVLSLFSGPPGQVVASVAADEGFAATPGGGIPPTPAGQIIEILQGATPDAPPAETDELPAANGEAIAAGKTGDITNATATIAISTGNGDLVSQVAVDDLIEPQGRPANAVGENSVNSATGADTAPANGTNTPDAGQVPQNAAAPHTETPGDEPQIIAVAPNSVKAADQATQAAAQGAIQAAGAQPATLPTEQPGSRAAARPNSSAMPNSSAQANGGNGANPAVNGIPSAAQAQTAPGQIVANQAVTGQPADGQPAPQSASPAPPLQSLPPTTGATPELAPTTGLDAAGLSSVGADSRITAPGAALQSARAMTPQQPTEQIAVQISQAVQSGADKITVQLRPENLGRVSIELEIGKDNRIIAVIAADRQDTLDLLQRDSRALERALNEAGLKTDSGSLSFSLRGDGDQPEAGEAGEQFTNATLDLPAEDDAVAQISPYDQSRSIGLDGGINIRV